MLQKNPRKGKLPPRSPGGWLIGLQALVIVVCGLFIYSPAFHGDWLWDDDQEITANKVLPDPAGLIRIWKGETGADYLPVKSTVQWVLFRVLPTGAGGKIDPTGYHLVNVGLHVLAALLVWRLLWRLGLRGAWLGGLLFAIHPLMVESVAWVSELKNTLSMVLLLLAMLAYVKYDEREKVGSLVLAVVLFLAASLSKASVLMFPVTILLYAWWKRGVVRWRDLLVSAPFFLISAVLAFVTIKFQWDRAIAAEVIPVGGLVSRTATVGLSILFYLSKAVLPIGLIPIYPKWQVDPPSLVQFLPWIAIVGGLAFLWTRRHTWSRGVLFGLGFFLISVFPVIGFIRMSFMRITWTSDHLVYLPMLGLIGLAAGAVGEWYARADGGKKRVIVGGVVVVCGLLIAQSHRYAGAFANEYELWTYTLQYNPDAWQAHSRLGRVLSGMEKRAEAFHHIAEAVRLRPDLAETHNNYGAMLEKKGDLPAAMAQFQKATELAPNEEVYQNNYAILLVNNGKYEEARAFFARLLERAPNNPDHLCNFGCMLAMLGRNDEAIEAFQKALKIAPNSADAQAYLQEALKKKKEKEKAVSQPLPPARGGMLDSSEIKLF